MSRNLKAEQERSRQQISEVLPFQNSQPLLVKAHSEYTSQAHNAESMEASKLNKDWPANTKAEWRLS